MAVVALAAQVERLVVAVVVLETQITAQMAARTLVAVVAVDGQEPPPDQVVLV